MSTYAGVYKAKCVTVETIGILAEVPQVFGTLRIPITEATGAFPVVGTWGYVGFESGQRERPIWFSAGSTSVGATGPEGPVGPPGPTGPAGPPGGGGGDGGGGGGDGLFADFKTNEYDVDGVTSYVGMARPNGDVWLVQRVVDSSGDLEIRWANVSNNPSRTTFTAAWTNRATLVYDLIDDVIVV